MAFIKISSLFDAVLLLRGTGLTQTWHFLAVLLYLYSALIQGWTLVGGGTFLSNQFVDASATFFSTFIV